MRPGIIGFSLWPLSSWVGWGGGGMGVWIPPPPNTHTLLTSWDHVPGSDSPPEETFCFQDPLSHS